MLELKRILWNRRTLLLFGILLLLHGVFFIFQCNEEKAITLTGEDLTEYIEGYQPYIQSVQENVVMMKENPLFGETDSFVYRNLIKTGEDYQRLVGIRPVAGENRGVVAAMQFNLTTFLLLLIGIYIVLCFLAERQKGLYLLVRCTKKGRAQLALQRMGILFLGLLGAAVLLFGSIYAISMLLFPGGDITRPVQSIPEFGSVIGTFTIGEYMCLFLIRKVAVCLLICLLLYFCMSVLRSSACLILFFLLMLGEYAFDAFLLPNGKWSILKYLNIYTYAFCGTDYASYYNLNVFGRPLHIAAGSDWLIIIETAVLFLVCLLCYSVQYPRSEYRTLRIVERLRSFFSKHKTSLSLMGWELKKVLISQKGLAIFVILIYLAFSASTESNYMDFRSHYVSHWYQEYYGEVNEELVASIRTNRTKMEDDIARWEASVQLQTQYKMQHIANGNFEGANMIQSLIIDVLQKAIEETRLELIGISPVLEQAEAGLVYHQKTGRTLQLIDAEPYELLFQNDKRTILRNYLYTLLTVVLMMSGIMACEKASHMDLLLNSFYKGRKQVLRRKLVILLGVCVLCTLSVHLVQYVQIDKVFEFTNQEALIQSVPCKRAFPIALTIRQYLYFLYTVRVLISVAMGGCVMYLSSKFGRITTMAFGVFLLIIPMGLLVMRL